MSKFTSTLIKTDITSLKLYENYLLAGIGSQLHLYDLNQNIFIRKDTLFNGLRIHTIEINPTGTHCLLTAENELLLIQTNFKHLPNDDFITIEVRIPMNDWILTTKWLQYNNFVIVSMHNNVEFYNNDTLMIAQLSCATKCILYCAHVCSDTVRDCVVLSGTVFSEILVWRPNFSDCVMHYLKGHEGVLFSINYFNNHILSTSDDRSVTLWQVDGKLEEKQTKITLKHQMHGHTARVFACKITENYLFSAGEDGKVNVWDFKGNLKKTFNVHHGGCVWSLEYDKLKQNIITGGSDSSIAILPLFFDDNDNKTENLEESISRNLNSFKLRITKDEIPKKLCVLHNGDIIVIAESGLLMHYVKHENIVHKIGVYEEFRSYSLLEVSSCRRKFALAGIHGDMVVYSLIKNKLVKEFRHCIAGKRRIYALHWLTCNHILSCGPNGVLYLWKLHKPSDKLLQSCDKGLDNGFLLIGKYVLPQSKERWSTAACRIPPHGIAAGDRKGNLHFFKTTDTLPSHTIRKAHSHLGITHLYWDPQRKILTSFGRNSTLRTYHLDDTAMNNSTFLVPVTTDVLSFSWLATKLPGENTILGFSGNDMLLWDYDKRSQLFSATCGGGHRSWDAFSNSFVYIRDKVVNCLHTTRPIELTSSTHSTEMNTMKCLKFTDKILLISGGEDTTLRFSLFLQDKEERLVNLATIKSHLSSIRCLHIVSQKSRGVNNYYEIVTAGGRGQLIYWLLALSNEGEYLYCKEFHSFYEPQDEEIRVMDLTSKIYREKYLLSACSDGSIRIYKLGDNKIEFLRSISYKLRCILKLCIIQTGVNDSNINADDLLVTMATDGFLCFWNLEPILSPESINIKPLFNYQINASGINAFDFRILANSNKFCFLTGGDDNQISFVVFEYIEGLFNVLYHYKNVESHCAQITGAYLGEQFFITASLDQKLLVFEYVIMNGEYKVAFREVHSSTISDIKGINVFKSKNGFDIVLYGLGIEILNFTP